MKIQLNGVDALTGEYLVAPFDHARAAALARGDRTDRGFLKLLRAALEYFTGKRLGLPLGIDPKDPRQAGWGIIFHQHESAAVRDALAPLIEHRRQIGGPESVQVLEVRPGESWNAWLGRHGVAAGSVIPRKIPYYLLLIGEPRDIPFKFQHQLAVEYAVGRLGFEHAADYRHYATSLIRHETAAGPSTGRQVAFFGPRHDFDPATRMSADLLVRPLFEGDSEIARRRGFESLGLLAEDATRAHLGELFRQPDGDRPALLFAAAHGAGMPAGHSRQKQLQGALVCQDWSALGQLPRDALFTAEDLDDNARVGGSIAFFFACFGAGTPRYDNFFLQPDQAPPELADHPFLAALPQRLLSHPRGAALAVIGHVDRAWGCSFATPEAGPQLQPFENSLGALLEGWPVGHALQDFRQRYAALSAHLGDLLKTAREGLKVSEEELARAWLERNDARGYLLMGDPAARLRFA